MTKTENKEAFNYYQTGRFLLNKGDYAEAIEKFKQAESLGFKNSQLYSSLALAYSYIDEEEMASEYAKIAVEKDENNAEARYCLGVSLFCAGEYSEALENLERIYHNPEYKESICIYMANIYCKTSKFIQALKYANKALKYENSYADAYLIKGEIYYKMGEKDLALKIFLDAFNMGDDDKSLCYISKIYLEKNENTKALKYMRKLFHFDTENIDETSQKVRNLNIDELWELLDHLLKRYD